MLPRDHSDRTQITFDDHRLVANGGLALPVTLARHLGLPQPVQQRLDLGDAPGRANTGDKLMTLVAANAAWLAAQVMPHNLARWTARRGLGERIVTTKTLQDPPAAVLLPGPTAHPLGAPPHFASAPALALGNPVQSRPRSIASPAISGLTAPARQPTVRLRQLVPSRSASTARRVLSRHLAHHSHCRPPSAPPKAPADGRQPPVYPNSSPDHRACNSLTLLPLSSRRPSVSIGGFGLSDDFSSD